MSDLSDIDIPIVKPFWIYRTDDRISALDVKGEIVVFGLSEGDVRVLNSQDGKLVASLKKHQFGVTVVKTCGEYIFSGGEDGQAYLYKRPEAQPLFSWNSKNQWVEQAAFSPDHKFIAFSFGKTVRVVEVSTGEFSDYTDFLGTVSGLSWLDAVHICTASYKRLSTFNVVEKSLVRHLEWPGSLISLLLQPQGGFAVCGSQDQTIHIWDLKTGEDMEMSGFQTKIKSMDFHRQGLKMANADSAQLMIWDFSGKGPSGKRPMMLGEHLAPVTAVKYQDDGDLLASASKDGIIFFWRPAEESGPLGIAGVRDQEVRQICWKNENEIIVSHDPGFICSYNVRSIL